MSRRRLSRLATMFVLGTAFLLANPNGVAVAQEPAKEEESGSGRAFDGYFATGLLAGFAMFMIGKTARR